MIAHGCRAERKGRGSGWADDDIGSSATGTTCGLVQRSVAYAYESEDHRYFDGDCENAQDCADRPMGKIGEDEFVEQASIIENWRF